MTLPDLEPLSLAMIMPTTSSRKVSALLSTGTSTSSISRLSPSHGSQRAKVSMVQRRMSDTGVPTPLMDKPSSITSAVPTRNRR